MNENYFRIKASIDDETLERIRAISPQLEARGFLMSDEQSKLICALLRPLPIDEGR